jgi:hypothetical protein
MNSDQFNHLLAYTMLTALNTAGLFQQGQRMRALTPTEIGQLQIDLLEEAQSLRDILAYGTPTEWPPSSGRADVPPGGL